MSCAMFTFLGIYASAFQKNSHWIVASSFFLAWMFVIVAIALAWRDERRKLMIEETKHALPQFQITASSLIESLMDSHKTVLVYVAVVNLSEASSTIRKFRLRVGATQGDPVEAVYFDKASLRSSQTQVSVVKTENGVSYGNVRVMHPLNGLIGEDRGDLWTRYSHREGWLCFQGVAIPATEPHRCDLTLEIEDAAGDLHRTTVHDCPVESKVVFW
jgi:hypothetical protein